MNKLFNKRLYQTYANMKQRCYNPKNNRFKNYGERGIELCGEWLGKNGFKNFCEWAFENGFDETLSGKENSIDRIDVNKNYEPNNCRWISMKEQCRNRTNNIWYEINNEKILLADSSEYFDMTTCNIRNRQMRFNGDLEKVKKVPKYKMLGEIIQKDLDGNEIARYKTIKEIKEKYNYNEGNISNCLYNRRKTAYGFKWEYEVCKYYNKSKTNFRMLTPKDLEKHKFIINNYTKGNMSINECAEKLGISVGGLSNYISRYNLKREQPYKNIKRTIKYEKEEEILLKLKENIKPRFIANELNVDVKLVYRVKQKSFK